MEKEKLSYYHYYRRAPLRYVENSNAPEKKRNRQQEEKKKKDRRIGANKTLFSRLEKSTRSLRVFDARRSATRRSISREHTADERFSSQAINRFRRKIASSRVARSLDGMVEKWHEPFFLRPACYDDCCGGDGNRSRDESRLSRDFSCAEVQFRAETNTDDDCATVTGRKEAVREKDDREKENSGSKVASANGRTRKSLCDSTFMRSVYNSRSSHVQLISTFRFYWKSPLLANPL